jgi:hypothetical protein
VGTPPDPGHEASPFAPVSRAARTWTRVAFGAAVLGFITGVVTMGLRGGALGVGAFTAHLGGLVGVVAGIVALVKSKGARDRTRALGIVAVVVGAVAFVLGGLEVVLFLLSAAFDSLLSWHWPWLD